MVLSCNMGALCCCCIGYHQQQQQRQLNSSSSQDNKTVPLKVQQHAHSAFKESVMP